MTPTYPSIRLDDVADVALTELAGSYADSMCALRHPEPTKFTLSASAVPALSALVYGTAITKHIDAARWPTALAALTEGATLDEVAAAMVEHPEDVRIGLTMWAVGQHSEGSISLMRYREIVNLVDVGGEPVGEPGPQ